MMTEEWRSQLYTRLNTYLDGEYAASTKFTKAGGSVASPTDNTLDGTAFAGAWAAMSQATIADMAAFVPSGARVSVQCDVSVTARGCAWWLATARECV